MRALPRRRIGMGDGREYRVKEKKAKG